MISNVQRWHKDAMNLSLYRHEGKYFATARYSSLGSPSFTYLNVSPTWPTDCNEQVHQLATDIEDMRLWVRNDKLCFTGYNWVNDYGRPHAVFGWFDKSLRGIEHWTTLKIIHEDIWFKNVVPIIHALPFFMDFYTGIRYKLINWETGVVSQKQVRDIPIGKYRGNTQVYWHKGSQRWITIVHDVHYNHYLLSLCQNMDKLIEVVPLDMSQFSFDKLIFGAGLAKTDDPDEFIFTFGIDDFYSGWANLRIET